MKVLKTIRMYIFGCMLLVNQGLCAEQTEFEQLCKSVTSLKKTSDKFCDETVTPQVKKGIAMIPGLIPVCISVGLNGSECRSMDLVAGLLGSLILADFNHTICTENKLYKNESLRIFEDSTANTAAYSVIFAAGAVATGVFLKSSLQSSNKK